jgi:methylated-DNA-[protein]-cysteine S-methyltransferase
VVQTFYFARVEAPVGELLLAATERGLCRLQLSGALPPPAKDEFWVEAPERLRHCEEQLRRYFQGKLREFHCDLDLRGTPFQIRCWQALQRIPYGTTCSYAELARAVGLPRASRAVGQANHRNPVAIIIPCHRVIGADGSLTGYGGGLEMKRKLLRLEGVAMFQDAFEFAQREAPRAG